VGRLEKFFFPLRPVHISPQETEIACANVPELPSTRSLTVMRFTSTGTLPPDRKTRCVTNAEIGYVVLVFPSPYGAF
jgi:hypothetical protein